MVSSTSSAPVVGMPGDGRRGAPPRVVSWALLVAYAIVGGAWAAEPGQGETVYETRCAPCHGSDGGGNGPAAAALVPKPRNLRDPTFWSGRTAQQLRLVVRDGRPGTMMAPFAGVLTDAQIDDVVAYLQTFRPTGR